MAIAILCAGVFLIVLGWAILTPAYRWTDDGDCSGIIQHSVRVMSDLERETLWRSRYWLWREHGDQFSERLPLQPPT